MSKGRRCRAAASRPEPFEPHNSASEGQSQALDLQVKAVSQSEKHMAVVQGQHEAMRESMVREGDPSETTALSVGKERVAQPFRHLTA